MSEHYEMLKFEANKIWHKLLKASVKNKENKIRKHKRRLIELELAMKAYNAKSDLIKEK